MEDLELNANAYLPLRDVVFQTLREAILRGDLKPGERLMELHLASKLGVSRTPIREALEILAVQLACDNITEEQILLLEEKVSEFERVIQTGDIKLIAKADIDFHDIIYNAARNSKLMQMLSHLREQIYRYRIEYLKNEKNYPHLMKEHRQIIEGLKHRKKDFVAEMMKNHMINQANEVRNIIRRQE